MTINADRLRTLHEAATASREDNDSPWLTKQELAYRLYLRNAVPDILELAAEVETLRAENDELHDEVDTIDSLARAMATAIGWETEGDNWIEKARNAAAHLAASTPDTESETG